VVDFGSNEQEVLQAFFTNEAAYEAGGGGLMRQVADHIPKNIRPIARRIVTDLMIPRERVRAKRLANKRPLRLNLGCGSLALDDWINVDLVGLRVDLAWNLDRQLPFTSKSVDVIFHEHVIEHIPADRGYALLQECYRLLRPGGVLRGVVPDAAKYIRSYCDPENRFLDSCRDIRRRRIPALLALKEEFYGYGHQTIYDFETYSFFCRAAGFTNVEERQFGESLLDPCPDSEGRRGDSFYAEAVRGE
jgi:predicted SAM-dependent methyltransferase